MGNHITSKCEYADACGMEAIVYRERIGVSIGVVAALMMFILGVSGSLICISTGKKLKKYQYSEK